MPLRLLLNTIFEILELSEFYFIPLFLGLLLSLVFGMKIDFLRAIPLALVPSMIIATLITAIPYYENLINEIRFVRTGTLLNDVTRSISISSGKRIFCGIEFEYKSAYKDNKFGSSYGAVVTVTNTCERDVYVRTVSRSGYFKCKVALDPNFLCIKSNQKREFWLYEGECSTGYMWLIFPADKHRTKT